MSAYELSPRESELVELAISGLTNEGIAAKLSISVGTVNTYWLRIRLKVGGIARTDTVAKVIKERAERALRAANVDRDSIADHIADREHSLLGVRAELALLRLAMEQIKSTVWAADKDLSLYIIANGEMPMMHFGVMWDVGKTVYEIFKTTDPNHKAVGAHLAALQGHETSLQLDGEFSKMTLRALPLWDEGHEIIGCIGIMNYLDE
ncbi:MAG TPA: helix-turn-helix transcriptional regulator [Fimbriimonadaceae bacterium]|nr:helix-turn-helix transcriptional regulator [Fimbriimonadaceae bacterium]